MQATDAMAQINVKPLPYEYSALEPVISAKALTLHHDKHYAGYVATLNKLIAGTPFAADSVEYIMLNSTDKVFNNAAQVWNHEFYFDQFSATPKAAPEGGVANAIKTKFGSLDALKMMMRIAAADLFGSGWVWLVSDAAGSVSIVSKSNAGNPLVDGLSPLLAIDVWEHAYYVDYENGRTNSIDKIWDVIDWSVVESRFWFQ